MQYMMCGFYWKTRGGWPCGDGGAAPGAGYAETAPAGGKMAAGARSGKILKLQVIFSRLQVPCSESKLTLSFGAAVQLCLWPKLSKVNLASTVQCLIVRVGQKWSVLAQGSGASHCLGKCPYISNISLVSWSKDAHSFESAATRHKRGCQSKMDRG